jgi:curli biogenesis system outer membrane secretion channel CsgG
MKRILVILALLPMALSLPGQTNEPVKLAVLAESSGAAEAGDVLIANLSSNGKLQLLERTEIQRVYREQGLSAGNKDYLTLGHVLGADGLLLLNVAGARATPNLRVPFAAAPPPASLTVRLIAIKPGVVLSAEQFSVAAQDLTDWASSYAKHLEPLLPKLSLLVKDAIPISVVNLRCAAQSADAPEVERQLKLLTIERLSRERQLFVLERQRMQSLVEEKDLKLDESAFWKGSYLLEGVVDQNGHARDTITINARLTPPKGGVPLLMEVSGSRTNFAEVINRLADRVDEALKINAAAPAWNAAEEAAQYFNEAKWALGWDIYLEAQTAAEAAWALGKRDADGALLRVRTYIQEVPRVEAPGVGHFNLKTGRKPFNYVHINERPDPKYCDAALYALKCYEEFIRNLPDGGAKIISPEKEGYRAGIDTLDAVSGVLQHFNHFPDLQQPVAEKLQELRALARSVAELISKSPPVHDSYFTGDRVVKYDELSRTIEENPNIFRCMVNWGCYWQETPEESIALYRELISSPVFRYLHKDLWLRPAIRPRLVAWNENDRQRIPALWNGFVQELAGSPDVLLQLEAKAFAVTDAKNERQKGEAFTNFFNSLLEHREALLTNNVDVVYLGWGAGDLVPGGGVVTPATESLERAYHSEYRPKLQEMEQAYWTKSIHATVAPSEFEQQVQYLKDKKPYDFFEFERMFRTRNYSKAQAAEIQPLLNAYQSNLTERIEGLTGIERARARGGIAHIDFLMNEVQRALNPPAVPPNPPAAIQAPRAASVANMPVSNPVSPDIPETVTNVLTVDKFLPIPLNGLQGIDRRKTNQLISKVDITAHHWVDGKLLLDLKYGAFLYFYDAKTNWQETRSVVYPAVALLDPGTAHWDVIGLPEENSGKQNISDNRSTLWRGALFTSDAGQIKKYDFTSRRWKVLEISDGANYGLFAVNDHLYAANGYTVFEIIDDGKATRLLASTRRKPPASALDTLDLGTPVLFQGPGQSLRIIAANKIFRWTGNDWHEDAEAPPPNSPPAILTDGLLFKGSELCRLAVESKEVEVCLKLDMASANRTGFSRPAAPVPRSPKPTWETPPGLSWRGLALASRQSDLFLLQDHAETEEIIDEKHHSIVGKKVVAKDGCHAKLLFFSRDAAKPQKLFLKFDAPDGRPPAGGSPVWMLVAGDYLVFGLESPPLFNGNAATPTGDGYKAGVWLMPLSRLRAAESMPGARAPSAGP